MICKKCKNKAKYFAPDLHSISDFHLIDCATCGDATPNDKVCDDCSDEYKICSACGRSVKESS